jgi:hypothetical protein
MLKNNMDLDASELINTPIDFEETWNKPELELALLKRGITPSKSLGEMRLQASAWKAGYGARSTIGSI